MTTVTHYAATPAGDALCGQTYTTPAEIASLQVDTTCPRCLHLLTSGHRPMPMLATDATAGWSCDQGATLITEAATPGRGSLPRVHAVIYVCDVHQAEAEARAKSAGCDVATEPAPFAHRYDPWPCGHITAYEPGAAAALGTRPAPPHEPSSQHEHHFPVGLVDAQGYADPAGCACGMTWDQRAEELRAFEP